MALVTVDAVVDVARHVLVAEVSGIIPAMAAGALEYGVVIRVDVAGCTNVIGIAVTGWKWRVLRVIERRIRPRARIVAVLTGSGEELRLRGVARVCAGVVIRLMTADAGGRQSRVVVVYVAVCAFARRHHVRSGQRERGVVVVERRIRPRHRVMAHGACCREAGRGVRGIIGRGVILLVARVAKGAIQRVVVVDVAIRALPRRHGVRSGQGETRRRVVELAMRPEHRIVAAFARGRETSMGNRSRGASIIFLVAGVTRCAIQRVIVVDVAIRALPRRHSVRSRQRESGAVVVECRIQPGSRVVTRGAGLREIRSCVIRIRRTLVILQVTGDAGRAVQVVVIVHVAIGALPRRHGVHSRQREGGQGMVKRGIRP